MGLADTSKIEASFLDQGKMIKKQVHRVQVLDPATGTGTFLHEVIKYIRETYFARQEGMRQGYISQDLLPRIWGFEILMASYTMAHLKIGMMLNESPLHQRYTNTPSGFATSLSEGGLADVNESPLSKGGRGDRSSGQDPSALAGTFLSKGGVSPSGFATSLSEGGVLKKPRFTAEDIAARWLICNGHSLPYNPNNVERAKEMRKNMTKAECRLWFDCLQKIDKSERRVLRQHPIDHYIVDFYIASANLVIEVDGDTHASDDAQAYDKERTELLELYELRVIRFTNKEVLTKLSDVEQEIMRYINESPLSKGGRGDNSLTGGRGDKSSVQDPSTLAGTSLSKGGLSPSGFATSLSEGRLKERINIYLTNSLEEPHDNIGNLFSMQLARESEQASKVKKEQPIMIVMGNPPYAWESANKWDRIMNLMDDYKKEPGWTQKLQEQNSKWINDDYVKFIRYAEHFIEKNGEGIVAYICPHGFLDNPTFRGMRWHLLTTFDLIYTVDLHGNAKKKEVWPDGSKDDNVFDIQQGVAITFFVKKPKSSENKGACSLARVYHCDLYGKREDKYERLKNQTLASVPFVRLEYSAPNYLFVQKDFGLEKEYMEFVSLSELFPVNGVWITTAHDEFVIDNKKEVLIERFTKFKNSLPNVDLLHKEFDVKKKTWRNILDGWNNLQKWWDITSYLQPISYRPFDNKHVFYEDRLIRRTVRKIMNHFVLGSNLWLVFRRQSPSDKDLYVFCSNNIIADWYIRSDNKWWESVAPLYLYNDDKTTHTLDDGRPLENKPWNRVPNLSIKLIDQIREPLGLSFGFHPTPNEYSTLTDQQEARQQRKDGNTLCPEDIFDYIYAVLHHPVYRETYREFLKIDFPRIPFVTDKEIFWQLVDMGHELRLWHLMEHPESSKLITQYPIGGDNKVGKVKWSPSGSATSLSEGGLSNESPLSKGGRGDEFSVQDPSALAGTSLSKGGLQTGELGRVWINDTQYIDNVPTVAREFYIGGYQPAQKWLKDRKEMVLGYEDIIHYQKIIVALSKTAEVMERLREVKVV